MPISTASDNAPCEQLYRYVLDWRIGKCDRSSEICWSVSIGLLDLVHGLNQRPNVTIAISERLQPSGIVRRFGHMIRHQQVRITNFLVHLNGLDEIDIAFVREHLHKVVAMSADVAEMHVEDFLARSEVSKDRKS